MDSTTAMESTQGAKQPAKRTRVRKVAAPAAPDSPPAAQEEAAAAPGTSPAPTPRRRQRAGKAEAQRQGEAQQPAGGPGEPAAAGPGAAAAQAAAAGEGGAVAAAEEAAAAAPASKRRKKEVAEPLPYYSEALRPAPLPAGSAFKVLSWNVAGLRALLKKDPEAIAKLVAREGVDVVCLQEHKLQQTHCAGVQSSLGLQGWHHHWTCSTSKLGYSGVAILSRARPLAVSEGIAAGADHEGEGRVLTAEFDDMFLVNVYVPNSGDGLKRLDYRVASWDVAFARYLAGLQQRKPVVVTGDLNCAHTEMDIHSPKTNLRSAGFTQEERDSFGSNLLGGACGLGLVDTYRAQHPAVVAYTYFTYKFNARANNKGWRLDYFLASSSLMPRVHDSWLLPDVAGSDHVPIGLTLRKA